MNLQAPIRTIRPVEFKGHLANPHRGCCTFQHFNGDPLYAGTRWSEVGPTAFGPKPPETVVDGYLPSTVSYCRWYWEVLEPEDGRYDFSMIEGALAACAERGQTLAVRLMPLGEGANPLPDWYAAKFPTVVEKPHNVFDVAAPVYDSPEYLERFGGMLRAFAARFADHPLLESVDMAYIGPWGEGAGLCGEAQIERFTRLYEEAFPRVPRLALIGGEKMRAAVNRGAGWRCDCFGDLRRRSSHDVAARNGWNHMYGMYPQEVAACAADAWKTAPIHLETCWVPMAWYQHEVDIDFILQQGLKYHATYFMPKYTRLPAPWFEKLADFCNHLGYRFVYRQAQYPQWESVDGTIAFQSWIENVGVAPLYRDSGFALRFRQDDREAIVVLEGIDVRTWLPGDVLIDRRIDLPKGFRPGWLQIAAGIVDRRTLKPVVSFATTDEFQDRWVDLGGLELKR